MEAPRDQGEPSVLLPLNFIQPSARLAIEEQSPGIVPEQALAQPETAELVKLAGLTALAAAPPTPEGYADSGLDVSPTQDAQSLDYREGYNNEVLMCLVGDDFSEHDGNIILEKASPDNGDIDSARPIDLEAEPYCDPDTGIGIRVLQKTDTQAEVEITFYCPEEIAPIVSVSSPGYV